jgi:signal transduction histidine kinase
MYAARESGENARVTPLTSQTPAPGPGLMPPQIPGRVRAFLRRPGPRGGDGLLAAAMTALGVYLFVYTLPPQGDGRQVPFPYDPGMVVEPQADTSSQLWAGVLVTLTTAALAWRRTRPVAAFGVQVCAMVLGDETTDGNIAGVMAVAIGAYSVAAHVRRLAVASVVLVAATVALMVRFPGDGSGPPGLIALAVMASMGITGRTIGTWRSRAGVLHGRALRAEREREVAVAQERARIARELHDVVSHNVSVMVIQTGAARMVLRSDPDGATEALRAVETSGRETMAELRHLLDVLTAQDARRDPSPAPDGDALGPPLAPQPDLGRLPVLVERVRTAGLDVRMRTRGQARPLPPGIELTAYRVVQEALTNALKYAPGARAEVTLTYDPDSVCVDIADDGPADGRRPEPLGAGRGLLGLTERVALHGGELRAGHRPTGGYRVLAALPVPVR